MQNSTISASVRVCPSAGTMKALTSSSPRLSGTPITAASPTLGWPKSTSSISLGEMFIPPRMIKSFFRSVMKKQPSVSR